MEKKTYKPKNPATTVRLPPDLRSSINERVARDESSMNEEIIRRLNAYEQLHLVSEVLQQNIELKQLVQKLVDKLC